MIRDTNIVHSKAVNSIASFEHQIIYYTFSSLSKCQMIPVISGGRAPYGVDWTGVKIITVPYFFIFFIDYLQAFLPRIHSSEAWPMKEKKYFNANFSWATFSRNLNISSMNIIK